MKEIDETFQGRVALSAEAQAQPTQRKRRKYCSDSQENIFLEVEVSGYGGEKGLISC